MPVLITDDAPLRALNAFGISARARRLIELAAPEDVAAALDACRGLRPLLLGGGSNLLFVGDVDAPVLRIGLRGRRILSDDGEQVLVEAAAGEPWHEFVVWTLAQGLAGLQNLALIPGTVGAAPMQNIGAYGVELSDTFAGLTAIDVSSGRVREFDANDCGFAYRDSFFKAAAGRDWLILAVRLRLARRAALVLDYGELRSELAARGLAQPTPRDVADAVMTIRQRKLPDPARLGNAGSFFKNPTVVQAQADALRDRFAQLPIHRSGAAERGLCKLSAAWMIEQCGWKGHRDGDAGVYSRHALVLVNHGNASGRQLLTLARRIADSVQQRFGIALEPEPIIVGDRWRPGLDER